MHWLALFLLASDPLPKELAYQLDQVRLAPAPISGALIVELVQKSKISPEQKRDFAEEAYQIASSATRREVLIYSARPGIELDRSVEKPWRADPIAVEAAAYLLYRDNWSEELSKAGKRMRLGFPARPPRAKSGCDSLLVSDPKGYFEKAAEAGPREFRNSLFNLNSSVELGRAVEASMRGGEDRELGWGNLLQPLQRLRDSDREFTYAMKRTQLHNLILKTAAKLEPAQKNILLGNYRAYLLRHFEGERCIDQALEVWKGVIDEFNLAAGTNKALLIPAEAGFGQKLAAKGKEAVIFGEGAGASLLEAANKLVGEETELTSFLTKLEDWKGEEHNPVSTGMAKAYLYRMSLNRLENHVFSGRVVASFVKYLTYGPLRVESPAYWLACADSLSFWAGKDMARRQELEYAGDPGLSAMLRNKLLVELPVRD